jgi:hypothetical protein
MQVVLAIFCALAGFAIRMALVICLICAVGGRRWPN